MFFGDTQHAQFKTKDAISGFPVSPSSAEAVVRCGGKAKYILIACVLGNICAKNCRNRTVYVKIIASCQGGTFLRHSVRLYVRSSATRPKNRYSRGETVVAGRPVSSRLPLRPTLSGTCRVLHAVTAVRRRFIFGRMPGLACKVDLADGGGIPAAAVSARWDAE